MSEFKDQWDRMTVVERIAHIRADWAKCRETDDPMVMRIASAVAHDVCRQAADEIERLRNDRTAASVQFVTAQMALLDRLDAMREERDSARREMCQAEAVCRGISPMQYAAERGWDCFKRNAK